MQKEENIISKILLHELNKMAFSHLYSIGLVTVTPNHYNLGFTDDFDLFYDTTYSRIKNELDILFTKRFDMNAYVKQWYNQLLNGEVLIKFLKFNEDFGIVDIIDITTDDLVKTDYKTSEILHIDIQKEISLYK